MNELAASDTPKGSRRAVFNDDEYISRGLDAASACLDIPRVFVDAACACLDVPCDLALDAALASLDAASARLDVSSAFVDAACAWLDVPFDLALDAALASLDTPSVFLVWGCGCGGVAGPLPLSLLARACLVGASGGLAAPVWRRARPGVVGHDNAAAPDGPPLSR